MNNQEEVLEVQKYLKKLESIIKMDCTFNFADLRLYDKKRIDDVICCIEGSWPDEYKKYIAKKGSTKLKTPKLYKLLFDAVKNRFLFSTSCYSVKYNIALTSIIQLQDSFVQDLNFIMKEEQQGMY